MSEELVKEVFERVAKENGYDRVSVFIQEFRDFKVQWSRGYKIISFNVSDYLLSAPECVLRNIAQTIIDKIIGKTYDQMYSEKTRKYLLSDEFVSVYRKKYLKRLNFTFNRAGLHRDLEEVFDNLVKKGYIDESVRDLDIKMIYKDTYQSVGVTALFRVMCVSDRLDREDTPDYVMEYVVLRGVASVLIGRKVFGMRSKIDDLVNEYLLSYPQKEEAEDWLKDNDFSMALIV